MSPLDLWNVLPYRVGLLTPQGEEACLLAAFQSQGDAIRFARFEAGTGNYLTGCEFVVTEVSDESSWEVGRARVLSAAGSTSFSYAKGVCL